MFKNTRKINNTVQKYKQKKKIKSYPQFSTLIYFISTIVLNKIRHKIDKKISTDNYICEILKKKKKISTQQISKIKCVYIMFINRNK